MGTTCSSGTYLQPSGGCKTTCPTGYYGDSSSKTCKVCNSACTICVDSTATTCTSCSLNYYLQPSSGGCKSTCPSTGYFPDTSSKSCKPCNSACSVCIDSSSANCTACTTGYFLQLTGTGCSPNCALGGWSDPTTNKCQKCSIQCMTCLNNSASGCTLCSFGYFTQPNSTSCLTTCPDAGFYKDYLRRTCSACDISCARCNSTSYCTECNQGYYLQPLTSLCSSGSPLTGYWRDGIRNIFSPCALECASCTGPSNLNCSSCNSGYFFHPTTTSCEKWIPSSFYGDSVTNVIAPCDESCTACTGPGPSNCQFCQRGFYLQPNLSNCGADCPAGYWKNVPQNLCSPCLSQCSTCSSQIGCLTCGPNFYLLFNTESCVPNCPWGFYENKNSHTCDPCDSSCLSCFGPLQNECNSCANGYFLQPTSNNCLNTCPYTGYFANTRGNICSNCSSECLTCSGPTNNLCSSCSAPFVLRGSTCSDLCQQGYFRSSFNHTCLACDPACKSCSGVKECLSCSDGYYLQPTNNGSCLATCPQYWYWPNPKENICNMCTIQCLECSGYGFDKCKSCRPGYFMNPVAASTSGIGECSTACPDGYYRNWENFTCANCFGCNTTDSACMDCKIMIAQVSEKEEIFSQNARIGFMIGFILLLSLFLLLIACYFQKTLKMRSLLKKYSPVELRSRRSDPQKNSIQDDSL